MIIHTFYVFTSGYLINGLKTNCPCPLIVFLMVSFCISQRMLPVLAIELGHRKGIEVSELYFGKRFRLQKIERNLSWED